MTKIPTKILQDMLTDPEYQICARYGWFKHACAGRITFDHAVEHAGRQVQKKWAIVQTCAFGHNVDQFQDRGDHNKEIALWIALNRAPRDELVAMSRGIDYLREKARLNAKYGVWEQRYPSHYQMARLTDKFAERMNDYLLPI